MPKQSIDYKARMKTIRSFVGFNYDLRKKLSSSQKAKINRYYGYLIGQISENAPSNYVYRSRKKENLKIALAASGAPPQLKQLKVAFVPTLGGDVRQIRVNKKGELTLKYKYGDSVFIPLDPIKLVKADAENYINAELDKRKKFPRYSIKYGEFDSPAMEKDFVAEKIIQLANMYSIPGNHNYKNWLTGVTAINITNQKGRAEYLQARYQSAIALTKARKHGKTNSSGGLRNRSV